MLSSRCFVGVQYSSDILTQNPEAQKPYSAGDISTESIHGGLKELLNHEDAASRIMDSDCEGQVPYLKSGSPRLHVRL